MRFNVLPIGVLLLKFLTTYIIFFFNFLHPSKAYVPIRVLEGMSIFPMDEHSRNADSPMLVTLLGITTLARALHFLNADAPMLVTLLGITTLARALQL